ncbi:hypothetical protein A9Q84_02270 [Halobacteriovorax marinus]|uniref:Peptidase M48 domain-containing protein n=1 Tax=Halobacteriovorax marinus TaxID=97084 RepID=A0A1Y5FI52_9BACT|nr:hypothetical protein A9Q84_02270 [Halobacteriovorax marinus]
MEQQLKLMKYSPKNLENEVNVGKGSPLKDFFKMLASTLVILSITFIIFELSINVLVKNIPDSFEEKLHNFVFKKFYASYQQNEKEKNVQIILNKLLEHSVLKTKEFQIKIIEDDSENALAHMGGRIVIHEKLLKETKTENSLALVLSHELGHYKYRHHLQGLGKAVIILSISLAANGSGDFFNDYISKALKFNILRSNRDAEREADSFSIDLLHRSYGHFNGAFSFFERISKLSSESKVFGKYFQTHPLPKERIVFLTELSLKKKDQKPGKIIPYEY